MLGRSKKQSKPDLAGLAVTAAVVAATERAAGLAGQAREATGSVRESVASAREAAGPVRDRVVESAGELAVAAAPVVESAVETVNGVLEDALVRGGAAWEALRGHEVAPVAPVRRWPYALAAALAGAAAGAAAVRVLRAVVPADAPGAQEPHELRAVVDTTDAPPATASSPAPTGPVPTGPTTRAGA